MKNNGDSKKQGKGEKSQKQKSKKQKDKAGTRVLEGSDQLDLIGLLEKHGCQLMPKESETKKSRLSPALADSIKDPVTLGYFMEFLASKDMRHFLDFYLAVNTFHSVTQQRNRVLQTNAVGNLCGDKGSVENRHCKFDANGGKSTMDTGVDVGNSSNGERSTTCTFLHRQKQDVSYSEMSAAYPSETNSSTLCRIGRNSPNSSWNDNESCKDFVESRTGVYFTDSWEPFSVTDINGCSSLDERSSNIAPQGERQSYSRKPRPRTRSTILDAVTIYSRYISLDADFPIGVPTNVRQQIEAEICKDRERVNPACFEEAAQHARSQLELLQKEFNDSTYGRIYQWHTIQEHKLKLEDVLYSDAALFYFMELLDQEGFKCVLEFWLMAENFQENMIQRVKSGAYNVNEAVDDAMALYERYFSMRSNERLIKDDKLRIVLENNICREDGPQSTCFSIPVAYAWTAMKEIFLPKFLHSETYRKYLKSLLKSSTRQQSNDETASTSSESGNYLCSAGEAEVDFLDKTADSLWYRPSAGRLALGHMDEFGNFVPESEPEPDDNVSKLSKAMRGILTKKGTVKDKEKEKIALENARQIIEDIQKYNR